MYWAENVVIGAINVLKMITCSPDANRLVWGDVDLNDKLNRDRMEQSRGDAVKCSSRDASRAAIRVPSNTLARSASNSASFGSRTTIVHPLKQAISSALDVFQAADSRRASSGGIAPAIFNVGPQFKTRRAIANSAAVKSPSRFTRTTTTPARRFDSRIVALAARCRNHCRPQPGQRPVQVGIVSFVCPGRSKIRSA